MKKTRVLFAVLLVVSFAGLPAQTTTTSDSEMTSTHFDMTDFPLWARDLRRAEIIAFGSFPFAYFFSNFAFDTYRWSQNGWDRRFAPWPITSAGGMEQTQSEKLITLGIAAGGAVLIALIDYGIVRLKRNRLEREAARLPEGTPVIIQKPLYAEEADEPAPISTIEELSETE